MERFCIFSRFRMSKKILLRLLLISILLADTAYSFRQNYGKPLDGDIVPIVLPSSHYAKVLEDPFGFRALTKQDKYAAPNRYFAHATMYAWYRDVYSLFCQFIPDRIQCLYSITALFQTLVQVLLIFLLSVYITGHARFCSREFLLTACLIMPFFQTHGYYTIIGIIDQAVSYTFFYAFPLALLLLYFLPFYLAYRLDKPVRNFFSGIFYPVWFLLAMYLAFSGPLIPPLIFLISVFSGILFLFDCRELGIKGIWKWMLAWPKFLQLNFAWLLLLCAYSFYLSQFNAENLVDMPLWMRYEKLVQGIIFFLTHQPALPLMILLLLINILFSKFRPGIKAIYSKKIFLLFILFALAYIILLPLGGYRPYRPLMLRYDTFLPLAILLIFSAGYTTVSLLLQLTGNQFKLHASIVSIILSIFMIADKPHFYDNDCQMNSLYQIKNSTEPVAYVGNHCTELTWSAGYDTAGTRNISQMLYEWKITGHYQAFAGEP
jgi:hypothetical protein